MARQRSTTPDGRDGVALDPPLRALLAVLAALAALAGSFAAAGDTPAFVVAPVNAFVVNSAPAAAVAFSIQTLGHLGDLLAFAASVALTLLLLALAAGLGLEADRRSARPFAGAVVAALAVWVLVALLTARPLDALASALPAGAVVALATRADVRVARSREAERAETGSPVRRRVLATAGAVLGFGVVAYLVGRTHAPPPGEEMPTPADATRLADQARARELGADGVPGLVSPTEEFYRVDIDAIDPMVDAGAWSLSVTGAVETPLSLSYADLRGMPAETKFKTLRCVGEGLNARLMDNAVWTGVPVAALLERAGPGGGCGCVMVRAADGYYEEFPLAALRTGFLAYGMNGAALPRAHGYPVRLLVPGHWGEINVKWVREIEVLEAEATGYWEERGWHGTGPVNTVAKLWTVNRLDAGRVQVAGHAYAGIRGVERVEISTDGGETWAEATLSDPLDEADVLGGRDAWRQWQYTWTPAPGTHRVVARAVDGEGTLQPRDAARAFPNGASGWVSRDVDV